MKAKGQIKIEEGLVLNNPTLEILKSSYNWHNNIVNIECIFKEENARVQAHVDLEVFGQSEEEANTQIAPATTSFEAAKSVFHVHFKL